VDQDAAIVKDVFGKEAETLGQPHEVVAIGGGSPGRRSAPAGEGHLLLDVIDDALHETLRRRGTTADPAEPQHHLPTQEVGGVQHRGGRADQRGQ